MAKRTVLCVVGTRPEVIKMAPVIRHLEDSEWAHCVVLATAQHRELLDQMILRFNIHVEYDLNLMSKNQSLSELAAQAILGISEVITKIRADVVLAQGDTTSVFAAALASFYSNVPFGHVEAGLRTNNLQHPFPEEGIRQMIARISKWHFAPTLRASLQLINEGIDEASIYVTGNTGIDTLVETMSSLPPDTEPALTKKTLLLTVHRRESFGKPLCDIFEAIKVLVERYPDLHVMYPVHPNPNILLPVQQFLANHPRINLLPPQDYFQFLDLMRKSYLILTDSGGVQEEAPTMKKPVLVLRNTTERPESVEAGISKVIGTNRDDIIRETSLLLDSYTAYSAMTTEDSPYGDGHASMRIVEILSRHFRSTP
jgi:UDP-N-acetylglucosamine 2-epimerase (non-hydrolysing)